MNVYELPELDYDYADLEPHLSAELLELHHSKHHAAYVKGANATLADLAEARQSGNFDDINQLQKNVAFHLSGHLLHSMLWKNLSPDGGGEPDGDLAQCIKSCFGSFKGFREQLSAAAKSLQGSGWASLAWDPLGGRLMIEQVYDHQGNIGNATLPILVLDMWEHAYYLDYRNEKAKWIKAWWELVNWQDVQARLAKVRSADIGLG